MSRTPDGWPRRPVPVPAPAAPEPVAAPDLRAGGSKPTPPTPADLDAIHNRRLEAAGLQPKEITK